MEKIIQGELFGLSEYTYLCRKCRGEFPRSIEFFPVGKCNDKLASFCRKCSNFNKKVNSDIEEFEKRSKQIFLKEKTCEECGEKKELRQFYMSSHNSDGKTAACKNCIDDIFYELQSRKKTYKNFNWLVYFIQDSRNYRVKIGSSDNPEKTLSELQEGSSEKLNLLAIYDAGEKDKAENAVKALHCLFQAHLKENGWFELVSSLDHYISMLNKDNTELAKIIINPELSKKTKKL